MPTTLRNTDILFNDGSTQGTAAVVDTTAVLNATAAASVGAVGTYASLRSATPTNIQPGNTRAGSSLRYSETNQGVNNGVNGTAPAGTWRCMGRSVDSFCPCFGITALYVSVYLRIS